VSEQAIGYNLEVRPAKLADILEFNGAPAGKTIKAFSIFWHGKLAAMAGITIEPGRLVFFSDVKEDIDPPKLTIWRASKYIVSRIKEMGVPVVAVANKEKKNSEQYLEKLGFTFIGEAGGERVYRLI